MPSSFSKWDIVYPLRYPEAVLCEHCSCYYTINHSQKCSHCNQFNNVSNIIDKVRPMILWVDQNKWYKSMAFGIPLSTSKFYSDSHNQAINIRDCTFFEKKFEKPMRAIICQATRSDGNVIETKHKIGKITDTLLMTQIENKLLEWLFG